MKNGNFIKVIQRVQNYPRWEEYAPRFEDNTASHSFRVALLGLMCALIEKKKFGKEVDVFKVVCRSIFHDLHKIKTGPIKNRTKNHPMVRERIQHMEREANEEIVSYLSQSLQPIFRDFIINAEDETLEGRIVDAMDTFDALMFCKREVVYGTTYFFPEKYEELKEQLKEHPLESVRWMVEQVEGETDFYKFLFSAMMLDRVRRWKGKFNMLYDDDATHIFRATALAIFNGYLEVIKYGIHIDMMSLVAKTLCHDLVEEVTGDVNGPVKHSTPETKKAFEEYEETTSVEMVQVLPDFLQEEFEEFMANAKSNDYVGQMVDIADKLDALIKSHAERKINPTYVKDYREQLEKVQRKYDNPCVIFFLAYILHDLDSDI